MGKKLKRVVVYRVDHFPGDEIDYDSDSGIRQSLQEFDERGNLTNEVTFTPDEGVSDRNEYRYDSSGRLAESLIYDENGDIVERKVAFRNGAGRLDKEQVHYLDGSVDTYFYTYDEAGRLVAMEVIDDEDSKEYSERYQYEGDTLVRTERLDEYGRVTFRQEDDLKDGIVRERKTWSDEEEEPFTLVHKFNEHGRRVQELRYDSQEKLVERNIYEEDDQGKVVLIIEENKQRKNTTEFAFDEEGRLVHQTETDLNGDLNHEVFRVYDGDGDIRTVTVEIVRKPSGDRNAYTLIYRYESY